MMPSGVAAAQARISAIESRFASVARLDQPATAVDFEQVLASARADVAGSVSAPHAARGHHHTTAPVAGTTAATAVGPAGAPPELAAYGNGRIPAGALAPIGQGEHRMWAPAAASFQQMASAAAREGVAIRVTDSYRSYDEQVSLAERKGLYSQGGLAARPGTSNHGWGRSLDIDTGAGTAEWLRANAARFGFHEDVPGEPWHWTYRPG